MTRMVATARFFAILAASVGLASIGSVRAASESSPRLRNLGGPDEFGYRFIDSVESNGPVFATEFEDISATGTAIDTTDWQAYSTYPAQNEGHLEVPIGFPFTFYGYSYSTTWVNTNNFLKFGGPTTVTDAVGTAAWGNGRPLPDPQQPNIIAAKWEDSNFDMTARYETLGTAPNRRFVVTWTGGGQTVEVKLYESGEIVMLYPTIVLPNNATVGVQDSAGTTGLLYTSNGTPLTLADGLAIRFNTPPEVINLPDPTGLSQFLGDGTTPIGTGGLASLPYILKATTDNPGSALRRLEVEVQLTSQPFTGGASHFGSASTAGLLTVRVSSFAVGQYHWRARVVEPATGFVSNWVGFGGNDNPMDPTDLNGAVDFEAAIGVGGPDAFGYTFADERAPNGPVFAAEWEDITASGTPLAWVAYDTFAADDEGEVNVPLGFTFPYYGTAYTDCWVNTNAFVKFGAATVPGVTTWHQVPIPTVGGDENKICSKWRDWIGTSGRYLMLGTAPDRRFVVSWLLSTGESVELKLYENGTILILIQSTGGNADGTVGLEDVTGTGGLLYTFNGDPHVLVPNRAIRFVPPPPTPAPAPPPSGGGGSSGRCGSVGLDLMVPLGLLFVWCKLRRKEHRRSQV